MDAGLNVAGCSFSPCKDSPTQRYQQGSEKSIKHEELAKLMKWKLLRGKFRPRLQQLVEGNSAESVETASKRAFKVLPNLRLAVEALTVLKGVGPATASAVLAAGAPHLAPFMADESMLALPGLQPLSYTLPAFLDFAKQMSDIANSLQKQDIDFGWTPHKVELVLWTVEMAKKMEEDDILCLLNSDTTNTNTLDSESPHPAKKRKSQNDSNLASKKKTKC
ncbi:uncharacterized protein LOC143285078 [Babylonia areolata]|uniref:uncharacterized protein LOC143285078 n=1 Tax=Babylonia areolata TaxID=304850 RepID=UPI003FCF5E74